LYYVFFQIQYCIKCGHNINDIFTHCTSVARPGESYLHFPDQLHGIDSQTEPLLTLWAERLVEPLEVPGRWLKTEEMVMQKPRKMVISPSKMVI